MLQYLDGGGVLAIEQKKRHEQSSWLSTEWRSSWWENYEVEEIGEDKEEGEKSLEKGCAGDKIVFGTQSLNELLVSIR